MSTTACAAALRHANHENKNLTKHGLDRARPVAVGDTERTAKKGGSPSLLASGKVVRCRGRPLPAGSPLSHCPLTSPTVRLAVQPHCLITIALQTTSCSLPLPACSTTPTTTTRARTTGTISIATFTSGTGPRNPVRPTPTPTPVPQTGGSPASRVP